MTVLPIPLACPNCSAQLRVTGSADRFTCTYCGSTSTLPRNNISTNSQPAIISHGRLLPPPTKEQLHEEIAQLTSQLQEHLKRKPKRNLSDSGEFVLGLSVPALSILIMFMTGFSWLLVGMGIAGAFFILLATSSKEYHTYQEVTRTIKVNIHHRQSELRRLEATRYASTS